MGFVVVYITVLNINNRTAFIASLRDRKRPKQILGMEMRIGLHLQLWMISMKRWIWNIFYYYSDSKYKYEIKYRHGFSFFSGLNFGAPVLRYMTKYDCTQYMRHGDVSYLFRVQVTQASHCIYKSTVEIWRFTWRDY